MSFRASTMMSDNYSLMDSLSSWTNQDDMNKTENDFRQALSFAGRIIIGVLLSGLIMTAIGGNLMVCYLILTDRILKIKIANRLLVSLAFSDVFVAIMVMPFGLINDILGRWEFGTVFCLIWECFDIMCSTASILNLCVICVERYLQVSQPFLYTSYVTNRTTAYVIATVWLISFLLSFVPLHLGWHIPSPEQRISRDPHLCILDLSFLYAVISSSISFYIPCAIVLVFYLKIVLLARYQAMRVNAPMILKDSSKEGSLKSSSKDVVKAFSIRRSNRRRSSFKEMAKTSSFRVTIILGVIVGVFLFCWLPFFIINPIVAKCATCISPFMFKAFTWLGWANSCVNPLIYVILSKDFRLAFRRRQFSRPHFRSGVQIVSVTSVITTVKPSCTR